MICWYCVVNVMRSPREFQGRLVHLGEMKCCASSLFTKDSTREGLEGTFPPLNSFLLTNHRHHRAASPREVPGLGANPGNWAVGYNQNPAQRTRLGNEELHPQSLDHNSRGLR